MVKSLTTEWRGRPLPLGTLLTGAGQRLSAELDAALSAAGYADLRASHAKFFMALDQEGTRVTELAERMEITKQAVGELVRYLSDRGYVRVRRDAADKRVRLVEVTARGGEAIASGLHVVSAFDRWLDDAVGADQVQQLRDILLRIIATDPTDR